MIKSSKKLQKMGGEAQLDTWWDRERFSLKQLDFQKIEEWKGELRTIYLMNGKNISVLFPLLTLTYENPGFCLVVSAGFLPAV